MRKKEEATNEKIIDAGRCKRNDPAKCLCECSRLCIASFFS
jgi:hypothetical protein